MFVLEDDLSLTSTSQIGVARRRPTIMRSCHRGQVVRTCATEHGMK